MYKFLTKNGQMVAFGLGILVIAIFLISIFTGIDEWAGQLTSEGLKDVNVEDIKIFDMGLGITIFLAIAAAFLAFVLFGALNLAKFPKDAIKLIGLVIGLLVVFFIFYSMGDVETTGKLGELHQSENLSDGTSKFISGGIWTAIGLALVAFVTMFAGELRNAFK